MQRASTERAHEPAALWRRIARYFHPGKSHMRQSLYTAICMPLRHETDICARSRGQKTYMAAEKNPGFATSTLDLTPVII